MLTCKHPNLKIAQTNKFAQPFFVTVLTDCVTSRGGDDPSQ